MKRSCAALLVALVSLAGCSKVTSSQPRVEPVQSTVKVLSGEPVVTTVSATPAATPAVAPTTVPESVLSVEDFAAQTEKAAKVVASKPAAERPQLIGTLDGLPVVADTAKPDFQEMSVGVLAYRQKAVACDSPAVFIGHRTSAPAPFANLNERQAGETVTYASNSGERCVWKVLSVVVESAADMKTDVSNVGRNQALLIACAHADGSPGGVTHRIVVKAERSL
jgi:LPXTG-site transpeptidase (sortase) family protein